jgi:hypothetical protein
MRLAGGDLILLDRVRLGMKGATKRHATAAGSSIGLPTGTIMPFDADSNL